MKGILLLIFPHNLFGFFDKHAAPVLILIHLHGLVVGSRVFLLLFLGLIVIPDDLLPLMLLLHLDLSLLLPLLLHHSLLLLALVLLSLSLLLLCLLLFTLFLLRFSLFLFLRSSFSLLLGASMGFSLRLCLCLSLCLSFSLSSSISVIVLPTDSKDLLDERSGVDSSGGSPEHVLKPEVGLIGGLSSEDEGGFDVLLLAGNHFD